MQVKRSVKVKISDCVQTVSQALKRYRQGIFVPPLLLEFQVDPANPSRKYVIQECVDRLRDKPMIASKIGMKTSTPTPLTAPNHSGAKRPIMEAAISP